MAKYRLPQRRVAPLPLPDREKLLQFLSHKGPLWLWQIERCSSHSLAPLETEHYCVLADDGWPLGHLSISHCFGVGILGHVYVTPEHRGQGLSSMLLEEALRQHPHTTLYLGCEPDSLAEALYRKRGFAQLGPGFLCRAKPDAPIPVSDGYQQLQFWHWPHLVALGAGEQPPQCWEGLALEWLQSGQGQVGFRAGRLHEHIQA